jgi:hypothetical protein
METKENSQWDGVQLIVNCSPYLVKIFSPALWVNTFAQIPFERSGAFKTSVLDCPGAFKTSEYVDVGLSWTGCIGSPCRWTDCDLCSHWPVVMWVSVGLAV